MSEKQTVFDGTVIRVNVEQVALPNGTTARYEIVHHPGGAAVVAVDGQQRVCLLRQFRPAGGGWVWELPAGRLEPGEPPQSTAQRELQEEAGCAATQWESLGSVLSSPGVLAETIHLYLARGLEHGAPSHEQHEVIEVHWLPLVDAARQAASGELRDAKTVIGLLRALNHMSQ
ncbi:MAG TPA: NUDIX hydrolase [Steroidobacteraceae bacterium]|nr:NUDIX hydrolase [Steroidobacteraceae bacterium]